MSACVFAVHCPSACWMGSWVVGIFGLFKKNGFCDRNKEIRSLSKLRPMVD